MTMPDQKAIRQFQKQISLPKPSLLAERSSPGHTYEKKLKTSLAFRRKNKKVAPTIPDEIGTAEHRPRHGLVYDAPLGLKF